MFYFSRGQLAQRKNGCVVSKNMSTSGFTTWRRQNFFRIVAEKYAWLQLFKYLANLTGRHLADKILSERDMYPEQIGPMMSFGDGDFMPIQLRNYSL